MLINKVQKYVTPRNFSLLLLFLFACGIFFHWFPLTRSFVIRLTDLFLLLMNGGVLYFIIRQDRERKIYIWVIFTVFITYLAELAGVLTGKVFGFYLYASGMHWKIAAVPVVIALNWAVLILGSWAWAILITKIPILQIFVGIILIVLFDMILEPLAMKMDYWQWAGGVIPLQNYLAWAVIAGIFFLLLKGFNIRYEGSLPRLFFVVQIVFFLLILLLLP